MTLLDPPPTAANSTVSNGIWTQFRAMVQRWFALPETGGETQFSFEHSEEEGSFVVAPCGYRIRVPRPDDVHRSVGEIVPSVRAGLDVVPPLPHAVVELLNEIQNPNASSASVAEIAARDPAMAATLVRAVNAASMGMSRKITSVSQAVSYLGFSSVKSLLLQLNLSKTVAGNSAGGNDVSDLWVHSLMVSYIAKTLTRRVPGVDAGFVSTFGLLHDIGKLMIRSRFPEETKALRAAFEAGETESLLERERKILGVDHAGMGAQLAANWKLPADLVEAIRWHHFPERAFEPGDPKPLHQAMYLVQIANQLAKYCYAYDEQMELEAIADAAYRALGFASDLNGLLDAEVCDAASRAIFVAEEGSHRSADSVRRFLNLHRGDEARRYLSNLDSSRSGNRRIDVDNEMCESLFNPEIAANVPFSQPITEVGIGKLDAELQARLVATNATARDCQAVSLVSKCIFAGAIGSEEATVDAAVCGDGRKTRVAFRSFTLSFANRFGTALEGEVLRALESELASLLNLRWFDSICTSTDGRILVFTLGDC